jgi:hypothetical protein
MAAPTLRLSGEYRLLSSDPDEPANSALTAFLTGRQPRIQSSRTGELSEGREALRTAGLETGATILGYR